MPRETVVEGLIYELAYDLVRQDGKWLVSSVSVLAEDKSGDLATINSTRHKRPRPEDVVLPLPPKEPQVLSLIEAFSGVLE